MWDNEVKNQCWITVNIWNWKKKSRRESSNFHNKLSRAAKLSWDPPLHHFWFEDRFAFWYKQLYLCSYPVNFYKRSSTCLGNWVLRGFNTEACPPELQDKSSVHLRKAAQGTCHCGHTLLTPQLCAALSEAWKMRCLRYSQPCLGIILVDIYRWHDPCCRTYL